MSEVMLNGNGEQPERVPQRFDVQEIRRRIKEVIQNEKSCATKKEAQPAVQQANTLEHTVQQASLTSASLEKDEHKQKPVLQQEREFTLLELIGNGGFGEVYKALWHTGDRIVTVKYCDDMSTEILLKNLAHPNITRILGHGQDEKGKYIIREYVDGKNLKEMLGKDTKLTDRQFLTIARQIIDAIYYLHAQGIVHGDIKPENILIPAELEKKFVKVTDFGLSRSIMNNFEQSIDTTIVRGTMNYMAPEQLYERQNPTQLSDIYSLAKLLLRMRAGKLQHYPSTTALKRKFGQYSNECSPQMQLNDDLELCLLPNPSERTRIQKIKKDFENLVTNPTRRMHKEYQNKPEEPKTENKTSGLAEIISGIYESTIAVMMPGYTLYQYQQGRSHALSISQMPNKNLILTGVIADIFMDIPFWQMITSAQPLSTGLMYLMIAGLAGKLMITAYLDSRLKKKI